MNIITENEMIDRIRFHRFNSKCNNYFFTNVENVSGVIKRIPFVSEITNYELFKYQDIGDKYLQNVIVDMKRTSVEELLNKALEVLNNSNRYRLSNRNDCIKLQNVLRKLRKNVQYIFYNAGSLSYEDVRLFNDLLYFTSFYMNQVVLFEPGEDLATYQTTDKYRVLTDFENYNKLKIK